MFGVGLGDVIAGLELILKIYELGFRSQHSASEQYNNFRRDIDNFRRTLVTLSEALENAEGNARNLQGSLADVPDQQRSIVGDFLTTLEECDTFLQENQRLLSRSNFIQNLGWHFSQRDLRVGEFRRRLQLHSEKVRLVTECVALDLLSDTHANTEEILYLIQNVRANAILPTAGNTHVAGVQIAQRFMDRLRVDARPGIEDSVTLEEGFDVLVALWNDCPPMFCTSPQTYVLFVKTRWFSDYLKTRQRYLGARSGLSTKRAIKQLEQKINSRACDAAQFPPYSDEELMTLPGSYFRVWPLPQDEDDDGTRSRNRLVADTNEELIASVEMLPRRQGDVEFVSVFKLSDGNFRILPFTQRTLDHSEPIVGEQQVVSPSEDSFVRWYALPTATSRVWEVRIIARRITCRYKFRSWENLRLFQTAIIGYENPHEQDGIYCEFSKAAKIDLQPNAYIQLWQNPIPSWALTEQTDLSTQSLEGSSDTSSTQSGTRHRSSTSSNSQSDSMEWCSENLVGTPIKLPAILIIAQVIERGKNQIAIIFMELDPDVFVEPGSCKCKISYDRCLRLVVESSEKRSLPARFVISELDSSGRPDLSKFNLFPFSLPRRKQVQNVSTREIKDLVLAFQDLAEKDRFHKELHRRFLLRKRQISKQRALSKKMRFLEGQPMQRRRMSSLPSSTSLQPPQLELLDSGPAFLDAF